MSLSGVTFSGLASGLDTRAIVDALVVVERRPIFALQEKKQGLNRSKSLFSDFQKKLEALQEKVGTVKAHASAQYNAGWNEALDLRNLVTTRLAVARAALMRSPRNSIPSNTLTSGLM